MNSALDLIESVKDYKVLFVGDTIIDEYHYVTPLGKSAKENLIPVRYESQEVFRGGVEAAANHLRTFCKKVDVASYGKVVRKVRIVDKDYMRKLFEVHYLEDPPYWAMSSDGYDVTVAADFGAGKPIEANFLAVSTQTNSSNIGFNLITKYPRADYIVIDEPEARLAAADRDGHIHDVIHKLAHGRCNKFVVTHGRHGAYGYENGKFYHHKAFTDLVRDTMGAGDAFFAVTAPMAKTGSMEDLLLIGNAAGAIKTGIVGHRSGVTKELLIDFIRSH
jgi:bifunctional ADP-heptose synthase (sugar kinase/adenylyltransferase)